MSEGLINGNTYRFPHCDSNVLHAPSRCTYCDSFPEAQEKRVRDGVNFTGEQDPKKKICPAEARRKLSTIERWGGNIPYPREDVTCICIGGRSHFCKAHPESSK
jgi:hypothetical protein